MLDKIGNVIDRTVGIFSPRAEVERRLFRERASILRRQYAAAKTTRLTGDWHPINQNINQLISSSSSTIRARVRQLVRDFPYFARAVNVVVDYTVGSGLTFQSRIKDPSSGKIDKKLCQKIEDGFKFWMDEADTAGRLHFYEMMRLAKRQDVESGEFLLVKTNLKDRNRFCPFALQAFEADWLTSNNAKGADGKPLYEDYDLASIGKSFASGNAIHQGIEYDRATGRIVAYHLADPDNMRQTRRIPAENVIYGFETLRPGQLRGVSPFAPAVLVAHDLSDYMDAEIDAAKMASKWLAFIQTPDPVAFQAVRGVGTGSTNKKIEEIENAIIEYLRPGEQVNIASHNRPGDNFDPTVKLILRMVAVTVGISYELLSGDYKGINYSSLRGIRNDVIKQFQPIQNRHRFQFCRPAIRWFMDSAVLAGKLDLPGYFTNPYRYLRCEWMSPGIESVDPLKEGKADVNQVKANLKSPQEIAARRGRDIEDIYDEIAAAKALRKEKGLTEEDVNTALANNPAAVAKQK